ncbi:MAG: VWA domain-containing protein, partial [Leptospiraceae bacterium]|nr:VWA domain-containing protein [Leptospiraceae bacterium]
LITDGENTHGVNPELAAKYIESKNIYLFVIGMAGEKPVPVFIDGETFISPSGEQLITSLDDESLEKIAKAGNGLYFRAKNQIGLKEIFDEISFMSKTSLKNEKIYLKVSYAPKFAWIVVLLFILWLLVYGLFVRIPIK